MPSLSLSEAVTILASYDSSHSTAATNLMQKQALLKSQQSVLNNLVASSTSQTEIANQASVVNNTKSEVISLMSYMITLRASSVNANKVLLASNGVGPTGPVNNPLVGTTGPTGPQGPTGAAWSFTTDSTPTQGSSNPVTSGGVYSALHAAGGSSNPAVVVGTTGTSAVDSSVRVLCHFEEANNSTTITDSSSYNSVLNCFSGAKITTALKKFGSSCLDLTTVGSYVSGPSITLPSTSPWSIEYWVYPTTFSTNYYQTHLSFGPNTYQIGFFINGFAGGNYVNLSIYNSTGSYYCNSGTAITSTTQSPGTNQWYHVCILFDTTATRLFLNGQFLYTGSGTVVNPSGSLRLGTNLSANYKPNAYIDELRIVVGSNKYNTNFNITSPTTVFSNTTTTFPSPSTQGQLWSDGTNVYICTTAGSPGIWRRFSVETV